jgi:hypothetical protein
VHAVRNHLLVSSAALLLPLLAAADSQLETAAASAALRDRARVDFKIVIPKVLSMDMESGTGRAGSMQTVAVMSNSRNVTLTSIIVDSSSPGQSGNTRKSVILNAAARKIISQDAACAQGSTLAAHARGNVTRSTHRVICTVSMP